ncbi:MAG: hypothetical protein FJX70_01870 [Alphaproteobacteria bacterium]|nr:hypothetical protein [Alphaproteobacteria bacterium]
MSTTETQVWMDTRLQRVAWLSRQDSKKETQLKDRQTKQAKAVQEAESNRYTTRLAGRKLPKE